MTELEKICYRRNFLTQVIARVDLLNPIEELKESLPDSINETAIKTFPVREPRKAIARELQLGPKEVATRQSEFTEWHFHGRRREKTYTIAPSCFFVSYKQYETYDKLREEFLRQARVFFQSQLQAEPSRLGLRYINQIDLPKGDPLDWEQYLRPEMLSIFRMPSAEGRISRALHTLELAEDEFQLRCVYGMHNPDYPAPIKRKLFVLDFDAYRQGHFQPSELDGLLDRFHQRIQELFEESITDDLRGVLNDAEGA